MSNVKINMQGKGRGAVYLDGQELGGVRGFTVTAEVGQPTRVELDVLVLNRTALELVEAEVFIHPAARDTLTALGWTPPPNPQ